MTYCKLKSLQCCLSSLSRGVVTDHPHTQLFRQELSWIRQQVQCVKELVAIKGQWLVFPLTLGIAVVVYFASRECGQLSIRQNAIPLCQSCRN